MTTDNSHIAELVHPTSKFSRRFIWKVGSDKVTVLKYDPSGYYDGLDRRADKITVRRLWEDYLAKGWVRTPIGTQLKLRRHDMEAIKYLEGPVICK